MHALLTSLLVCDCLLLLMMWHCVVMVHFFKNVKKLMKVSYSKSRVSMAVHRVGKTLLLEKFDPGMVAGSHTNG